MILFIECWYWDVGQSWKKIHMWEYEEDLEVDELQRATRDQTEGCIVLVWCDIESLSRH